MSNADKLRARLRALETDDPGSLWAEEVAFWEEEAEHLRALIVELVAWIDSDAVRGVFITALNHGYTVSREEAEKALPLWNRARAVAKEVKP
jgi:hypothetical protein